MRSKKYIHTPKRLLQMEHQRHGRSKKQRKGEQEREPRHVLEFLPAKHMVERREDERTRHQARHERIEHNLDAPVDILVRINEQFF